MKKLYCVILLIIGLGVVLIYKQIVLLKLLLGERRRSKEERTAKEQTWTPEPYSTFVQTVFETLGATWRISFNGGR